MMSDKEYFDSRSVVLDHMYMVDEYNKMNDQALKELCKVRYLNPSRVQAIMSSPSQTTLNVEETYEWLRTRIGSPVARKYLNLFIDINRRRIEQNNLNHPAANTFVQENDDGDSNENIFSYALDGFHGYRVGEMGGNPTSFTKRCECGAKHTSTPHIHLSFCPLYKDDQWSRKD